MSNQNNLTPLPTPPMDYRNAIYALILATFVGFVLYLGLQVNGEGGIGLSEWQQYVSAILVAISGIVGGFVLKALATNRKNIKDNLENKETLNSISDKVDTNINQSTSSEAQITFLVNEMSILRTSNRSLETKLITATKQIHETNLEIQKLRDENAELRQLIIAASK